MRFAYADPPYLGCGYRYPEHPEALTWDDPETHRALIVRLCLEYPDGWAGRKPSSEGASPTRDHLSEGMTMRRGLTGVKPDRFCSWVLDLLGFVPGDEVVDLFPGSGGMGRSVLQAQGRMFLTGGRS